MKNPDVRIFHMKKDSGVLGFFRILKKDSGVLGFFRILKNPNVRIFHMDPGALGRGHIQGNLSGNSFRNLMQGIFPIIGSWASENRA